MSLEFEQQFPNIKFFIIDRKKEVELAEQFQVQNVPMFVTVHNGEVVSKWFGGNRVEMKSNILKLAEKLKQM
jgi:thioredoxin-like negative regulator of GroEL